MTLAQFQSYHIERYYWFQVIIAYDAAYWAYYSDWSVRSRPASKPDSAKI